MRIIDLVSVSGWSRLFSPVDAAISGSQYESRIISVDGNVETKPELHIGKITFSPITIRLDNTDGTFTTLFDTDIRGTSIAHSLYDLDASAAVGSSKEYVATKVDITRSECSITATPYSTDAFDIMIPKSSIQTDVFGSGVDESAIGKPVSTWFGYCTNIPLYSIYEGGTGDDYQHIFLIGHGTIASTGSVTVYRDDVEVDKTEYTVYDGSQSSPFNGYAIIVFGREQRDGNGSLYDMKCSAYGIKIGGSYNYNPCDCLEEFLTNSTWGLGLTVDSTSFDTVSTACSGASTYAIKSGFYTFKKASEWIDYFLAACNYSTLSPGSGSGYTITFPTLISTTSASFTKYNMANVSYGNISSDEYVNTVNINYNYNITDDTFSMASSTGGKSFGLTEEFLSPFTLYAERARRMAIYLKNCFLYKDKIIEFETGQDGYDLSVGNIISITYDDFNLSSNQFEIIEIEKTFERVRIKAASYSSNIFRQT